MQASVLIVDDERHTREGLRAALEEQFDVSLARDAEEAERMLGGQDFDVVLTDLRMPGKSGLKVIDEVLAKPRRPVVIMMTAYGSVDVAVEAMKRGAYDFLTKPVDLGRLEALLKRAVKDRQGQVAAARAEAAEVEEEPVAVRRVKKEGMGVGGRLIVGESSAIRSVSDLISRVAPARTTVLIEGETGTGKELVAQAVHAGSPRVGGPFVAVHCAALPATLLESELFGHEKGAFTGATERRIGRFEAADGGTLFLDEIGEIGLGVQVKLLRFLETRTFERVGSLKPITVDVRLVAATNRNLVTMVKEGTFREDLLYRLNVVTIVTPPLRERVTDLPLLLDHFARQFAEENGVPPPVFEASAMAVLQAYPWPGNVRELRNFVENVVVLNRTGRITEYDLDPKFGGVFAGGLGEGGERAAGVAPAAPRAPVSALSVEENEKRLLREALVQARGNRTKAAELLGISRRTLHRKLVQFPELDVRDG